jgi:MFS family permease
VTTPEPERLLSRGFVFANLTNLLFFVGTTVFYVLPVHLEHLGASRAEVGRVMGAYGIASMMAIPVLGLVIDRIERRHFIIAGALLWTVVALAFSSVTELGFRFFPLRMLQGVSFALAFVSANALILEVTPRAAMGRAISIFGTTTLTTHAVGPALGEWILHAGGFRVLCYFSAIATASACVMALFIPRTQRSLSVGAVDSLPAPDMSFVALCLRPEARSALAGGLTSALAFGATLNFMPIFVHSRHLPSFSPFFTAYVVAAISVRLLAGGLGDRIGYRRVGIAALFAFSIVVAAFALIESTVTLVMFAFAFGVAHGFCYPSLNALFIKGAPDRVRGRAMAAFNLSFNMGATLAAFSGGEIAQRWGYEAMWLTMGGLSILGTIALVLDRSDRAVRTVES